MDDLTADDLATLDLLIRARRRSKIDVAWDCLQDDRQGGVVAHIAVDLIPHGRSLDELNRAFDEARDRLLALVDLGLIEVQWMQTPDPYPGPRLHAPYHDVSRLWFRGAALERLGPSRREQVPREVVPTAIRYRVMERDGFQCVLCDATEDLTLDHIIPHMVGGSDDALNLRVLCRSCNSAKGIGLPDHIRLLGRKDPEAE